VLDVDGIDEPETPVYCPTCWEREFGEESEPDPLWLLACGHKIRLLKHERPAEPPERPRMCPACGKPRQIVGSSRSRLADE
jgi:hypothetical protein